MLNDGFGAPTAEETLIAKEGFIRAHAHRVCSDPSKREDVAQEGRVALWQSLKDGEQVEYAVNKAKQRMQQIAWYSHRTPPTGSVHEGNRYEPQAQSIQGTVDAFSGNPMAEDVVAELFGLVDRLEDVEWAYHAGEIAEALSSLTPKQRVYVYARFWCGMDTVPGSRNESLKIAKEQNPQVNDRSGVLWSGNKTTVGARERLVARLSHLRELVA